MRPELYLSKLIETTASRESTPDQLATAMVQTMEILAQASPVGAEALAIVRNKIVRKHLAEVLSPFEKTRRLKNTAQSAANGHAKAAMPSLTKGTSKVRGPMSAETKAKLAKSAKKRWKAFREGKGAKPGGRAKAETTEAQNS